MSGDFRRSLNRQLVQVTFYNSILIKKTFILYVVLTLLLTSCSSAVNPTLVVPTVKPVAITSTPSAVPTATFTSIPATVTPTATAVPCNPHTVDYCITDGNFVFAWPVQSPNNDSVDGTYRYASTANGTRDPHHGVEIGKNYGIPILAAADGVVLFAGPDKVAIFSPWTDFYGNMIVIQHSDELYTLYGHMSALDVQAGDVVTAGQKIGEMGQSGAATGSHLHFEVRRGDVEDYFATVNPELWLKPKEAHGVLKISITDAENNFQHAELTIGQYLEGKEPQMTYYSDTYDKSLAVDENFGMGNLLQGRYRITLIQNGQLYERWVEVQSGKLTEVVIALK